MNSKGGTEIQKEQLVNQLDEKDLEGINLIASICHPDLIQKDKINVLWQHLSYDQPNVQLMRDRRFVDSIDYFVYNSHWCVQRFRERFQIPDYKSFVIKNASFEFEPHSKISNKIKLIYTSTPWRGLNVLVLAIDYLNTIRDDFECDVYSSTKIYGSKFEEMEKGKFDGLFERCKNTKNINYKGYATNEEVRKAVSASHIFAYPSTFEETSCIAVIEAMMAGCKVVTTNHGALIETCADFAEMVDFEPNLKELAVKYAHALNRVIDAYKQGAYKEELNDQVKYYNRYYSWKTRIKQWKGFLNYVRQERR